MLAVVVAVAAAALVDRYIVAPVDRWRQARVTAGEYVSTETKIFAACNSATAATMLRPSPFPAAVLL